MLSNVRVVDLTQNVASPFRTQVLGDLGAEIIKIERPERGDDIRLWQPTEATGHSATFLALNRNKKSTCVDLDRPDKSTIVRKLASSADVVIHPMKPGSAEARGLGFDTLGAANPGLICCAISAFGQVGPLSALPGYDPLMQAFTGVMSSTGNDGEDPVRVGVSLIAAVIRSVSGNSSPSHFPASPNDTVEPLLVAISHPIHQPANVISRRPIVRR